MKLFIYILAYILVWAAGAAVTLNTKEPGYAFLAGIVSGSLMTLIAEDYRATR